jgi:hypothetical protein
VPERAPRVPRLPRPCEFHDPYAAAGVGDLEPEPGCQVEARETRERLRRASPKTGERRSFCKISAELAAAGYLNERGQQFNPNSN